MTASRGALRRVASIAALGAALASACSGDEPLSIEACPAGTTAVVGGCLPIPGRADASTADANPGDAAATDAATRDTGPSAADAGRDASGDGGITVEPTGRWAVEVTTQQRVENPVRGAGARMRRTIGLLSFEGAGGDVAGLFELCAVRADPFLGVTTVYPEPAVRAAVTFGPEAIVVAGVNLEIRSFGFLLGWTTDQPRAGDVPINATDERVIDADVDGNPGVTLALTGDEVGNVYVASRTIISLTGRATAPSAITGTSQLSQQIEVLGASNADVTREESTFTQVDGSGTNTFRLLRLDANANCQAALQTLE